VRSFDVAAILVCLAAAFAYVNLRYLRLHPNVGIMLLALVASVVWQALAAAWAPAGRAAAAFTSHLDLHDVLLHWMLGALLFAGALRVDLSELRNQQATVALLAILGTAVSTALIAAAAYAVLRLAGAQPTFVACAVFGAVVSPTDPVAVLGFMRQVDAPRTSRRSSPASRCSTMASASSCSRCWPA
jgi:CPA1 family monovalent cation:H+ antiporter